MRATKLSLLLLLTLALGCGSGYQTAAKKSADADLRQDRAAGAAVNAAALQDGKAAPDAKEEAPRKIIYTGSIELVVENFDMAEEELVRLVSEKKGYIAGSDVRGERGVPRSGRWTLRVPFANFDSLVAAITQLGETKRNTKDSQDVTEHYYDLKERLKTFQIEEDGLRKLYTEKAPTSKLEEIAVLRRELTQIRSQIEEMTGKLKRWDNQIDLATIVVTIQDRKDYVPPVVPNFGGSIGRTFQGSIEALVGVGKGLVLAVVALAPWLAILAVVGAPVWWRLWRAYKSRKKTSPQPAVVAPPAPSA